jgi:hypothetical protein
MSDRNDLTELLDADGFLVDAGCWDAELAQALADRVGLEALPDSHWRVIDELRAHQQRTGSLPVQQTLCREAGLGPDCLSGLFGGNDPGSGDMAQSSGPTRSPSERPERRFPVVRGRHAGAGRRVGVGATDACSVLRESKGPKRARCSGGITMDW